MTRTLIIAGPVLCISTAALAEPITINGIVGDIQYGKPYALGIAANRVTVDGRTYLACERITPVGWFEVACASGKEP
jgi:hypothetical protein